jgi:hypothetical protein
MVLNIGFACPNGTAKRYVTVKPWVLYMNVDRVRKIIGYVAKHGFSTLLVNNYLANRKAFKP